MKSAITNRRDLPMDSRHPPLPHLNSESPHYVTQIPGWMWGIVLSLSFLSIFQFDYVWLATLMVAGGAVMTLVICRESNAQAPHSVALARQFSHGSRCVWKLDTEA